MVTRNVHAVDQVLMAETIDLLGELPHRISRRVIDRLAAAPLLPLLERQTPEVAETHERQATPAAKGEGPDG